MIFDLQTHTQASDGEFTPTELVRLAKKKNVGTIAICDHDTVAGIPEALRAGKKYRTEIIPGVEISTAYKNKIDFHILGLGIDHRNKKLKHGLKIYRKNREERARKMVKKLKKMGYQINFKEVENFASGKNILRTHIAKALLNHKENKPKLSKTVKKELLVTNVLLALTSKGKKAYVPRKQMPIRTAIALIKQSGGISILSHPGTHKKDFKKNLSASFLKKLKKSGLNGIEALAGDHTASQNKYFFTLAKKLDFVISAGSDFHGRVHPKYKLGMLKAPSWVLPKLKKAIKSARTLHSSPSA